VQNSAYNDLERARHAQNAALTQCESRWAFRIITIGMVICDMEKTKKGYVLPEWYKKYNASNVKFDVSSQASEEKLSKDKKKQEKQVPAYAK